ncbi:hypothetical protein [Caminicella sporogenes]|uniref:hypothetical protein n=1 Tax=Caminicella sporogenes TaxID=166485 RepID=UPI00147296F9|nr:hypothetical protein [Caminicella sporogenes]
MKRFTVSIISLAIPLKLSAFAATSSDDEVSSSDDAATSSVAAEFSSVTALICSASFNSLIIFLALLALLL